MEEIALTIPGINTPIDSALPSGVPVGGLFNYDANNNPTIGGTGVNAISAFIILTVIISVLVCLWFLLKGGWDIITSRGKKEALHKGRDRVLYALLGLIFIVLSFLILGVGNAFLGTNLLPFVPFLNPK